MIDALSLLAGCLLAAGAPAPDGGAAAPAAEEHFLISFRGRVIGKARRTLAEEQRDGARRLVLTVEEQYRFSAGDRPAAESSLRRVTVMLPDWTPVSIEEVSAASGEEKRASAKFEAGKAVFAMPGGKRLEAAVDGPVVAEMCGQALAARGKLAVGAELAAAQPDLAQGGLVPLRAAVIGAREGGGRGGGLLLVAVRTESGRQDWDLLVEPSGALVEQSIGEVVRRRVDAREAVLPDRPEALWEGFVPLAGAPAEFGRAARMTVVLELPEPAKDLVPELPGQKVAAAGRRVTVTLSARRPDGTLPQSELSADDLRRWARPDDEPDWRDPKIAALAAEITKGQEGELRRGFAIGRWVYRNLIKSLGGPPEASARQALAARGGDCSEHAALFAALCRAAGLPARTAWGLAGSRGALRFHVWSEFRAGGAWVPVDTALGRFGLPACYVTLGYDREEAGARLFKFYAAAKGQVTDLAETKPAADPRPAGR